MSKNLPKKVISKKASQLVPLILLVVKTYS